MSDPTEGDLSEIRSESFVKIHDGGDGFQVNVAEASQALVNS